MGDEEEIEEEIKEEEMDKVDEEDNQEEEGEIEEEESREDRVVREKEKEGVEETKETREYAGESIGIGTAAEILADRLKFVGEVTSNPKKSHEKGYETGSNIVVVAECIRRVLSGDATVEELLSLGNNIGGIVMGAIHTGEAFKKAESLIEEIKKKTIKELIRRR